MQTELTKIVFGGVYMSTRGAKKGNQNATKERKKSAQVVIRCFEEDRAAWEVRAKAENLSLAAWICKELNRSSDLHCKTNRDEQ